MRATPSDARRTAWQASYLCAALAAGLLALHYNAGLFPAWTRGLSLLSGGLALAGAGLAAYSLGRDGWANLRYWPGQVAFALNALFAAGFIVYVR